MKCAAAVIFSRSGRYVLRSIQTVNQAGVSDSRTRRSRPASRQAPVPSRWVFATALPQAGWGTVSAGICWERRHGSTGAIVVPARAADDHRRGSVADVVR